MAYERHDVFNIGPTGTPQADPRFAEQMALAQFQASQDNAERMIQEQAKSREAEAIQAQIARAQEVSDRDWHHQNVTLPAQQMAMMKAVMGLQGAEADRQLAQAKFDADMEDRDFTRSFREREAKRKSRDKELARDYEGRQWEKEKQWDLDQFNREKEHDLRKHAISEFYKDQKDRRSAAEKAEKERRTREETARKEGEARDKSAREAVNQGNIYKFTQKLFSGADLSEKDFVSLQNDLLYLTGKEREVARDYLDNALANWKAIKDRQLKAEEEQHKGASTGLFASLWEAMGQGKTGDPYVQEKMAPSRQKRDQQLQHLIALIGMLENDA